MKYVAGEAIWNGTDDGGLAAFALYDNSIYIDGVCVPAIALSESI